ncbi:MAG: class I SAM-dependent methyltransferase [Bacteroidia bacterium]|nr:class I SAM-dependent methyltransferase [Bacteroidia bacterium]
MLYKLDKCPVCGSGQSQPFISCKDYTVSQETFNIVSCSACGFKYTNPRPSDDTIGQYYKSEDYVSHTNTKKGLINRLYHAVRSYTLKKKLGLIESFVSRGTILDYGCGTGMFLNTCKEAGWKSFGFEPDSDARTIASKKGLSVFNTKESLALELGSAKFDVITLWHVLEHVTDLDDTLSFFKNHLSNKGTLIIAVPNYTSFDAQHYKEYWAGYDIPRHIYHFNLDSVSKLLSKFGFTHIKSLPMKFDSFYVSMLSEKYKTGSIRYLNAFINGLRSNLRARNPNAYSSVIYIFKKA